MKQFSFLKIYLLTTLVISSSNAFVWSLSYYAMIESQIKADVTAKMNLQIREVQELKTFYESEIKTRATTIKENKTKLNMLDIEIVLLMKKIAKKEDQVKRLIK